jgi:hypothetical protein
VFFLGRLFSSQQAVSPCLKVGSNTAVNPGLAQSPGSSLSRNVTFTNTLVQGTFRPLHRSQTMGDHGLGHSQAINGSQTFSRFGSPSLSRNRANSVQKGLVAESPNPGAKELSPDGKVVSQPDNMVERKISASNLATSARNLSNPGVSPKGIEELPIEILSLVDR